MNTENPIVLLFKSRKFILALAGVIIDLVIVLVPPDIAPRIVAMREELLTAVTVLFAVVIGGIAVEDHAEKSAPTTLNIPTAGDTNVVQPPTPPTPRSLN